MKKTNLCNYNLIITTSIGNEEITASYIEEVCKETETLPKPLGFKGIVLVQTNKPIECASKILEKVSFVEKTYVVNDCVEANIDLIAESVARIAKGIVGENNSFAIRTIRRGKHEFSSIDVNVVAGKSVQEATGARVDLETPDITIFVNIIGDWAFISIEKDTVTRPKGWKTKYKAYELFKRITVVQEPYISSDVDASFKMGERLGRAVQTYEIGRYIIALIKPVPALPLASFIRGVEEGIESRFAIQRKSYSRKVTRTQVEVYEMHLVIRSLRKRPVIIFEPEGRPLSEVSKEIRSIFKQDNYPVLVFGSREGVPTGLFRFADIVVDVAPGITLSTDQAIPTALGAILSILGGEGVG